jgi:hypothetical protein
MDDYDNDNDDDDDDNNNNNVSQSVTPTNLLCMFSWALNSLHLAVESYSIACIHLTENIGPEISYLVLLDDLV